MRRVLEGGEPLHGAGIGQAEGADAAVGPGLDGGPLDGVVAVRALVAVGLELALGGVAAAHVLEHDRVAPRDRRSVRRVPLLGGVLAVRRPVHQDREATCGRRPPDVGSQHDAVAHRDRHIALDDALLSGRRCRGAAEPAGDDHPDQQATQRRSREAAGPHRSSPPPVVPDSSPNAAAIGGPHAGSKSVAASPKKRSRVAATSA